MEKQQRKVSKQARKAQKQQKRQEKSAKKQVSNIQNHDKNLIFVLGNGTSRRDISPHLLKQIAPVYGCNALYRTFSPNILVAVDAKMIKEITEAGYQNTNQVWTNPNRSFEKIKNLNFFKPSKGWSSGPTALWFASQSKPEVVYILGFDYQGNNGGKHFNNVFSDTKNYKKSTDSATYYGNWLRQTCNVLRDNPDITYYRVITEGGFIPKELVGFKNLHHITVNHFKKHFNL